MLHVKTKSVRWKAKQIFRLVPLVITRNVRLPGYDGGRSVYTAMGHTRESYAEPRFVGTCSVRSRWPPAARGSTVRPERLARACVVAALAFAACGSEAEPSRRPRRPREAATEAPATAAARRDAGGPAARRRRLPSPAINSVTVDPGDGTIMVGSGRRCTASSRAPRRPSSSRAELDGGTVSGNLVVRFAGPGDLLASGHPQEGSAAREPRPDPLDGPRRDVAEGPGSPRPTITSSRSRASRSSASTSSRRTSRSSSDGGATLESAHAAGGADRRRRQPGDPQQWAVSTEQGTFMSSNGGRSWRPRDTTFGARLAGRARTRSTASIATARSASARTADAAGRTAARSAACRASCRSAGATRAARGRRRRRSSAAPETAGKHGRPSPLCADGTLPMVASPDELRPRRFAGATPQKSIDFALQRSASVSLRVVMASPVRGR